MPTQVDEAIEEIKGELVELYPQHEGLRDYARLNLLPPTLAEINISITQYDRRVLLLETALRALEDLADDGHPDIPIRELSPEAFLDLQTNLATVQAAFSKFSRGDATSLSLTPGSPELK